MTNDTHQGSAPESSSGSSSDSSEDSVISFQLDSSHLRGRIVRMGAMLDHILLPHGYPEPIARMTAEVSILAALLSSTLKYDGIFTLQVQGDGPVSMVMADVTTAGDVRACATFGEDRIAALDGTADGYDPVALMGKGYMAFTVDQGPDTERYQGIVQLKGSTLVECVQHYFSQSEQIATGLILTAAHQNGHWTGGAILLQKLPQAEEGLAHEVSNVDTDDWRRAMILLESCTDEELSDMSLHAHDLLFRLFHEEGVRIFEQGHMRKGCRCSPDRLQSILKMMPADDIDHMVVDGAITMTCQFCNQDFAFDPADIRPKINND